MSAPDRQLELLFKHEIAPRLSSASRGLFTGTEELYGGALNWCESDLRWLLLDRKGRELPPSAGGYVSGGAPLPRPAIDFDEERGTAWFVHETIRIRDVPAVRFILLYDRLTGTPVAWEAAEPSNDGHLEIIGDRRCPLIGLSSSARARQLAKELNADDLEAILIAIAA